MHIKVNVEFTGDGVGNKPVSVHIPSMLTTLLNYSYQKTISVLIEFLWNSTNSHDSTLMAFALTVHHFCSGVSQALVDENIKLWVLDLITTTQSSPHWLKAMGLTFL